MRIRLLLMAGSLLCAVVACRQSPTSATSGGIAAEHTAVGPVPGAVQNIHYRTNPFNDDAVALQDGRRLFDWYNCSGCHGGHAGGGMGPSLRDPVWLYGNRDDQIYDTIVHGRSNGMPAWGTKIPDNQIWELVAYIKSMGTPQEPDPPTEPADEEVPSPDQSNTNAPVIGTKSPAGSR